MTTNLEETALSTVETITTTTNLGEIAISTVETMMTKIAFLSLAVIREA